MCQRATGGLFAALAGSRKDRFVWSGEPPASYASSNLATRHYCAKCGTPLTFAYNQPEARIYVTIGSLDDPESAPIETQFGIEDRLSWVQFCDQVPQQPTLDTQEAREFFAGMIKNQS